jgi:DNA-binding PadR family transcriptional regulator
MRTEDLEKVVLRMFGGRESYGYKIQKELASKKIQVDTSRLYRTLTQMVKKGLLESRWQKGQLGPRQRIYRLGEKGRKEREKILLDAIGTVHGFYSEYLLNLPPKTDVFYTICKMLSSNLKGKGDIGYVTLEYSVMHEKILRGLHGQVPEGNIHFVKPASLTVDLDIENLWYLHGTYDYIPLRDGYVDLLIVIGVPDERSLEKSFREWQRVLKEGGALAIVTPTIFVHKYDDPVSIGSFIEKHEYGTLEKGKHIEAEHLKALLKKSFRTVEERQIVHMTIFLACQRHFLINNGNIRP